MDTNTSAPIFRLTSQREIILEELAKLKTNPIATDIYDKVRKRLPRIGLGTVYRNLELMVENGMIRKVVVDGSQAHFEAITKPHYHFRCSRCGKVEDMDIEINDDLVKAASKSSSHQIEGHSVEFTGVCYDCQ